MGWRIALVMVVGNWGESVTTEDTRRSEDEVAFPSFRGTSIEIIRLAGDPECPHTRLVDIVKNDPALSMKILKFSNSALLGLESEVNSVSRAVTIIGVRALRNIAICFAACDAGASSQVGNFDLAAFFEDSLRRAAACEQLSRRLNMDMADEAFTVGLLQDFGVVALAMQNPDLASQWMSARRDCAEHRREHEIAIFGKSHDAIAEEFVEAAGLPKSLALAMQYHHRVEAAPCGTKIDLIQIASWAETIADVFIVTDRQPALDLMFTRLKNECNIDEVTARGILDVIPKHVEEYAEVLGLRIPPQTGFEDLIHETNRRLAEMNLSYQELTWKLEAVLGEKAEIERELRLANARLERLAGLDPLTEIANRRSFEESLHEELCDARRSGAPISMLTVDIDRFKRINDTFGHPFGDTVIRAVGRSLTANIRSKDRVARIGGEEFAVILPGTDSETGLVIADRLRTQIEARELNCGSRRVSVSVSIGGSTLTTQDSEKEIAEYLLHLMAISDQGLLQAKEAGRNRVIWVDEPNALPESV
jgi:diguanylate cyclase (GGDEF)-like protein